jgi:thymidylate synthase (FAD)
MQVKLVSYSQPSEEFRQQGVESLSDLVAFCARVSNPSNQLNMETSDKLIAYLVKHKHWSPLEMVSATIEITTTRDIARQILRHRSFAFQEFSQRYADPTKDMNFVLREARLQDTKNRQNSIENTNTLLDVEWANRQRDVIKLVQEHYKWAIENGIAKEQARAVLPEGLTESRLYMAGTLRSFLHFIDVRTEGGTQKEHRAIAAASAQILVNMFAPIGEFNHMS